MSDKEGRIKVALTLGKAREAQAAVERHFMERRILPPNNEALRMPGKTSEPYLTAFEQQGELSYRIKVTDGVITVTFAAGQDPVSEKSLVLEPRPEGGNLAWSCSAGTVEARYRPPQCR